MKSTFIIVTQLMLVAGASLAEPVSPGTKDGVVPFPASPSQERVIQSNEPREAEFARFEADPGATLTGLYHGLPISPHQRDVLNIKE